MTSQTPVWLNRTPNPYKETNKTNVLIDNTFNFNYKDLKDPDIPGWIFRLLLLEYSKMNGSISLNAKAIKISPSEYNDASITIKECITEFLSSSVKKSAVVELHCMIGSNFKRYVWF